MKRGLGTQSFQPNGNGIANNARRMGATPRHSAKPNSQALVVFRFIVIAFILLCLVWIHLIIKIAADMNDPVGRQPSPMLARSQINDPIGKTRIGWMIRQKINHVQLKLQHVPLLDVERMDSPILIITCNRAEYLERALWKVFEYHPAQQQSAQGLRSTTSSSRKGRVVGAPVIISQDGNDEAVKAVIETYRELFEMKLGVPLYRIEHAREHVDPNSLDYEWGTPYKLLAKHYGWALEQTFSGIAYHTDQKHARKVPTPPLPKRVIILEEDIEIAIDFFSLMNATADLLDSDNTLLAVSAFNDNGKEHVVSDTKRLVRSDFFPGLGWMMSRSVWEGPSSHPDTGLKNDWAPGGFWDDWLREPDRRWGRQIIRPEISRTYHFGNIHGASEGENNNILNKIELEENGVHWEDQDLSYLDATKFANDYWNRVSHAKVVETSVEAKSLVAHGDVRLVYSNFEQFKSLASEFDIMEDEKAGVPRTGYEGIVEIRYGRGNFFVFLTSSYVSENAAKPGNFGLKAWLQLSKDSLMKELGIENVVPLPMDPMDPGNDWSEWKNYFNS